jgi:CRP/FNR family transcriptional regulator
MAWTQLADYLGTTPETVSRTLKRLADEKLIQRTGKQVTILNAEDMEDFVW